MSFTREEAFTWAKDYSNVIISHDDGDQIQVSVIANDGALIWRDWSFVPDTSVLENYIRDRGIPLPVKQVMKRLITADEKMIRYYGLDIAVQVDAHWVATDSDGHVWCYGMKPTKSDECWEPNRLGMYSRVIIVDLNGIDWTTTLMEIE